MMLIEKTKKKEKKKTKQLKKKLVEATVQKAISQEYHWSPDVSVLIIPGKMKPNLAKFENLETQLNMTSNRFVHVSISLLAKENQHCRLCKCSICTAHERPRIAETWKISGLLWTVAGQGWDTNIKQWP